MLAIGDKVRVHRNLHRGDWSVTVRGIVVCNVASIALADCHPVYWQGGFDYIEARKAIGKPRRRVVAWIEGRIAESENTARAALRLDFERRQFVLEGAPLVHCERVEFDEGGKAWGSR